MQLLDFAIEVVTWINKKYTYIFIDLSYHILCRLYIYFRKYDYIIFCGDLI